MKALNTWITLAIAGAAAPVLAQTPQTNWWSQAGGENGPERIVWAAQKTPETPYTGVNKPIWHIADILKSHQGQGRWEEKVVLTRDFDGRYVQMASGDKAKCMFYADDRVSTPIPGYTYVKTKITSTGGYDSFNVPFFNVTEYGDSKRTGERFLYDGHTSSNLNIGMNLTELPPASNWGHWHANMVELWVNVYGNVCALI